MKYSDFYNLKEAPIDDNSDDLRKPTGAPLAIGEHESGGPISLDVNDPIPCESTYDEKVPGKVLWPDDPTLDESEFPARSLYPNAKGDEKIRVNNLKLAKELITILDQFKGIRGAKTKLYQLKLNGMPITSTVIKSIYFGLRQFSDAETIAVKKQLLSNLKKIYNKSISDCYSKDDLLETLTLKKYENDLVVVSDLEGRKEQSAETFRHKNELKKAGFRWDGKLNSWVVSTERFQDAQKTIAKINKKPLEVIISTLDDLPEFVLNADNISKKQELAGQIESFVTDLSNEVDEAAASEKVRAFFEFNRRFRNYSIVNTFLIYLQKNNATRVAGFHAWRVKFHRNVKKGAKAISIFAPQTYKERDDKVEDGDLDAEVRQRRVTRFIAVNVFDVSDTEPIDASGELPVEPQWYG